MGPKMESKWSQDPKKESPELILAAMKVSSKKMFKKCQGGLSGKAGEPGLGAPNKGTA